MEHQVRLFTTSVTFADDCSRLSERATRNMTVIGFYPSDKRLKTPQQAYMRLMRGDAIEMETFTFVSFDRESPSLLLTERPLEISKAVSTESGGWLLRMP